MRHNMDSLPGLAAACKTSTESLQAAYDEVEQGRLQDHPKQLALRRTLMSMSALRPVRLS
jgi:hypothetical protein